QVVAREAGQVRADDELLTALEDLDRRAPAARGPGRSESEAFEQPVHLLLQTAHHRERSAAEEHVERVAPGQPALRAFHLRLPLLALLARTCLCHGALRCPGDWVGETAGGACTTRTRPWRCMGTTRMGPDAVRQDLIRPHPT